jgi:antitoxin component of RelBE/YafQ-DinJ toxin-antitoxin module
MNSGTILTIQLDAKTKQQIEALADWMELSPSDFVLGIMQQVIKENRDTLLSQT